MIVALIATASAQNYRVDGPFCDIHTLQDAVGRVNALGGVGTIYVKNGTTNIENNVVVLGVTDLTILNANSSCTLPSPANPATITGNHLGPILIVDNTYGDVVRITNLIFRDGRTTGVGANIFMDEGGSLILRGTQVLGGSVFGAGVLGHGGNIYLGSFNNLEMYDSVVSDGSAQQSGGGIYAGPDTSMTLVDSSVTWNKASMGGGVLWLPGLGATTTASNVDIHFNEATADGGGAFIASHNAGFAVGAWDGGDFDSNTAGADGGGIFLRGQLTLESATVRRGLATNGGGIHIELAGGTDVTLNDVAVTKSEALTDGGGIYLHHGGVSAATIRSSNIDNNVAGNRGGGMVSAGFGETTAEDTVLRSNSATRGGGLYVDTLGSYFGRFFMSSTCGASSLYADQYCSEISLNESTFGGGLVSQNGAEVTLDQVALNKNYASAVGDAIIVEPNSFVSVQTSLISRHVGQWADITVLGDLDMDHSTIAEGNGPPIRFFGGSTGSVNCSIASGPAVITAVSVNAADTLFTSVPTLLGAGVLTGANRLHGPPYSPQFITTARGDYRLGASSDALNHCTSGPSVDLDGDPRPVPFGTDLDFGAFER